MKSKKIVTPIPKKSFLADTPPGKPSYAVSVNGAKGEEVCLADPRATRALVALMDMEAALGGAASHFGGPSAFAEIMSALHAYMFAQAHKEKRPWHELFHFVNDAGHCENGLYALKANYNFAGLNLESLKGFRSLESCLTGHGEAHLFPQGVLVSNGPLGSALPQAQGLCLADYLEGRGDRVTVATVSDGACMEGEAKEALTAIPGLCKRGKMAPFVLIVSDNNTKLSGRIDEQSFSMVDSFSSLKSLGWKYSLLENAHDLETCYQLIAEQMEWAKKNMGQPVFIHAKTIKGFGVKAAEESNSGGHGFPLKKAKELKPFLEEIYQGENVPEDFLNWCRELEGRSQTAKDSFSIGFGSREKVQMGISKALIHKKNQGLPVVSVNSDLYGSTGVGGFVSEFPESSLDMGVAEANMISVASGLAKRGFIPVVDTFAQFGTTKGALPLLMSSLSQSGVIAVFSHAGFQDAADGASHQSLNYLSITCSFPQTKVYVLSCSSEAQSLMEQAIDEFADQQKNQLPLTNYIFFLGRELFPQSYCEKAHYKLQGAQLVGENYKEASPAVTIVTAGPLLEEALRASQLLEKESVGSLVVNLSCISHPDIYLVEKCLKKSKGFLLTVEDHQVKGGLGAMVSQALALKNIPFRLSSLGVQGQFGQSAYTSRELYGKHQLDAEGICRAAFNLLGQG